MLDMGIIAIFLVLGVAILGFTAQLAALTHLSEGTIGLIIGSAVLALSIPPGLAIWRALRSLADSLVEFRLPGYLGVADKWTRGNLYSAFRDTAMLPILVVPGIWSIPLVSKLLALGSLSAPLSLLIVAGIVTSLIAATFRIYRVLNSMFSQTFMSDDDSPSQGSS